MEVNEIKAVSQSESSVLPEPNLHSGEMGKSPKQVTKEEAGNEEKKISSLKELTEALQEINEALEPKNIALNYSVDDSTDAIVVKVIEKQTDKVIRQIPPEEVLNIRGNIQKFLGVIYDQNG
jgi:flagellar protein FlaG